ncbi:hypothetical protein SCOCK_140066 [Actinacidiphila cocklensis]|uniref:Uncharacterized protein n=1 Tax=Actinacidiphila cocklensis TaxID=887465 RepID=A0A9W4DPY1_9ACTN|nr:hypothetical protein SCOCK_140066 [Actinacidiphila cocklensis]
MSGGGPGAFGGRHGRPGGEVRGTGPDRGGVAELWNLTDPGLDAARRLLERDADQMGGSARGVGRGGAPHAMAVNATIIAIIRGGIGGITSWRTEVPHPLSSTGKRNVRADAVLCAPDDGLPLLMLEVDRGTEPVSRVAAKLASYVAFYRRSVNDPGEPSDWTARMTGTGQVPFWETLYPDTGLPGWPPLAMVFTGAGPRALANRMRDVAHLSRERWAAEERADRDGSDGYPRFHRAGAAGAHHPGAVAAARTVRTGLVARRTAPHRVRAAAPGAHRRPHTGGLPGAPGAAGCRALAARGSRAGSGQRRNAAHVGRRSGRRRRRAGRGAVRDAGLRMAPERAAHHGRRSHRPCPHPARGRGVLLGVPVEPGLLGEARPARRAAQDVERTQLSAVY